MISKSKYIINLALAVCFSSTVLNSVSADVISKPVLRTNIDKISPTIDLKDGVQIDKYNKTISLSLRNSDLRQVLRMLADKAGKNIVLDDSVKGTVTLDLYNTNVNKAFNYLMTLNQLTYWQDSNTIVIATAEQANKLGMTVLKLKPIKIKYLDATVVARFLNKNLFSLNKPGGTSTPNTVVNPKTNEVLIFGNDSDIALAQKFIDYVDVKPQIKTFNINYANVKEMGSLICDTVFKSQGLSSNTPTTTSSTSTSTTNSKTANATDTTTICSNNIVEKAGALDSLDVSSYRVIMNTALNQITIYGGTQEEINQAENVIARFDKKQPQVYIEVSIVELNSSGSRTLANEWTFSKGKYSYAFDGTTNTIAKATASAGAATLTDTITMEIKEGKGKLLANPKIIATNNKETKIDITSEYVKTRKQQLAETTGSTGTSLSTSTTVVTTNYEIGDSGIQLSLTPKISPNGYVTLDITPTYSSIKDQVYAPSSTGTGQDLVATLLNKRDITLEGVRVKDGQTLVIGGLIQENDTNTQSKAPILGNLPLIGSFFKNSDTEKSRSELVLMITPKIIKDTDANDNSI